jgi:hypothetical protein
MQVKTISKTIKSKLTEWLETITDEELRKQVKENILVSGGSITSMFLNMPVNDYDIYIQDRGVLHKLIKYYVRDYCKQILILDGNNREEHINERSSLERVESLEGAFSSAIRNLKDEQIKLFIMSGNGGLRVNEEIEKDKLNYTPLFFSPNAISLSNDIQIVIRFFGDAETIHKTFDFIHATNYFTFETGLVTNKEALESILTKQLKYQGSFYPITSIIRTKKFLKRNWNINAGELLKIMFQISHLDLQNPDVLEEQLIGVDVAYFERLIIILRSIQDNKKENGKVDEYMTPEYFNNIIDKVFNEDDNEEEENSVTT